jgi:D-tyrosyl-tRNA(Tyr) deacylase
MLGVGMRVVLQRVSRASVSVDGEIIGAIGMGFLALVGFTKGDGDCQIEWMAEKIVGLRVFPDEAGKMNRDVTQADGAILVVSQFTLYADARKGRRPSFVDAAPPDEATQLYEQFVDRLMGRGVPVETGSFGALMDVELVNDGPVTLILER